MTADPHFRLVIALDLSEYAEIVLEHALDQAARHTAPDLHFVTVVADDSDETVERAKKQLATLALGGLENVTRHGPDWRVRLHVRAGKPYEEIVGLAGEIDAHLIVVGRFGTRRLRSHLGTTAHRVIEYATCPVLAVNLVDRPIETQPQCPDCAAVRAESDGERWFCAAHANPDGVTLATTRLPPSTIWGGGGPMW